MKKLLTALLALTILGTSAPAFADYLPEGETREQAVDSLDLMEAFLSTEQFVPSRLEFREMSADPVAELITLSSRKYNVVIRARAIQSLSLYADDERAIATIDKAFESHRPGQKIYPSIIVAYAQVHGEGVVGEMIELAQHKRADVRIAAVIALGRFCGQQGFDALPALANSEENPKIMERIQSYLR
jgi:hypothetical protein